MEIKSGVKQFYIGESEEKAVARITYYYRSDRVIVVDHTFVHPSLRGQGIGKLLLDRVIAMARKENLKIIPVCDFAVSEFGKHPEFSDVLEK